ncbi:unnamed protein product [Adineta ricciae]|uniref:Uncharacterized protein n=1 Tax=Adineta ricciae TaxID=249248 RepID=A0A815KFQ0_ADIRI|nr:unnamed protein product [Adineta ricciae]
MMLVPEHAHFTPMVYLATMPTGHEFSQEVKQLMFRVIDFVETLFPEKKMHSGHPNIVLSEQGRYLIRLEFHKLVREKSALLFYLEDQ